MTNHERPLSRRVKTDAEILRNARINQIGQGDFDLPDGFCTIGLYLDQIIVMVNKYGTWK